MSLLLSLSLAMALTACHIASATLEDWSEVTRFTGTHVNQIENTSYFTIDYAEWRIRWSFAPVPEEAPSAMLVVYAYPQGNNTYVSQIYGYGNDTSGVSYIHNLTGTFYMTIATGPGTLSYTLIVEQDLDAIPEFPSSVTFSLILAVMLLIITVSTIATKRRSSKSGSTLKTN